MDPIAITHKLMHLDIFHAGLRGQMNMRQEKVIGRMSREGIDGFKGGLSAENYIAVTQTSRATATRDLQNLVEKGALTRIGELRHGIT
jgi:Fic family protein